MKNTQVAADVLELHMIEEAVQRALLTWRAEGAHLIAHTYEKFHACLDTAFEYRDRRRYSLAAAYASIAMHWAVGLHCGLFSSGRLEELLLDIGRQAAPADPISHRLSFRRSGRKKKNILHVCTYVVPIGGLTQMLRRWIEQDPANCHSVALTRQTWRNIPADLSSVITASGGDVYRVNAVPGGIIPWARRLRRYTQRARTDVIVLHTVPGDVVPMIAFADKHSCPPVVLLDHADHLFWAGVGISDVVISLRDSGLRLARSRRGVEPHRNVLLPIPLEPADRALTRLDAKKALNFPTDQLMLLSTARSVKYRNLGGVTYADIHAPVLKKHANAIFVVVGAGERKDWARARASVEGRIVALDQRADLSLYYQAADVYIDSFPFVSNTSLMEAAVFGTPVVSMYPYSEGGEILGADMPGLSDGLIKTKTFPEYGDVLSRLIADGAMRVSTGRKLEEQIRAHHTGHGWLRRLQDVYDKVDEVVTGEALSPVQECMCDDEPDVFIRRIFGMENIDAVEKTILRNELQALPFMKRIDSLFWLLSTETGGTDRLACIKKFVPEWALCHVRTKRA